MYGPAIDVKVKIPVRRQGTDAKFFQEPQAKKTLFNVILHCRVMYRNLISYTALPELSELAAAQLLGKTTHGFFIKNGCCHSGLASVKIL
jgi:hypothetical protein